MARNEIRIAGKVFSDKSITSGKITLQSSLPNDELTVDVFNATIDGSAPRGTRFVPKGSSGLITADQKLFMVMPYIRVLVSDPTIYRYGEVVGFYRNGTLFRKFYMNTSRRIGKFEYEISCISDIGLLESSKHYGGVYRGLLLKDLMADIIGDAFPYTVDISVQNISIYGWLPVATRRENLHQVIFAHGISVKRDANGDPVFSALSKDDPSIIGKDRMFVGGKIRNESLATRADVTEHVYVSLDTDDSVTLFDGQISADDIVSPKGQALSGAIILFSDPAHTLSVSGAQVLESGDNYAVLSQGVDVKLTGKKYTHITRVVTKYPKAPEERSLVALKDNVVSVDNATLVSFTNSESVAERIIAYYGFAKSVDVGITVGQEMPGDPISFEDPWGDVNAGFIEGLNITISATLKASAQLLAGYIPPDPGGHYTRFTVLTGTGTWTVPPGVSRIRVVPIGAGWGGGAGTNGVGGLGVSLSVSASAAIKGGTWTMPPGSPGIGGNAGSAGLGGKIFQATESVTPGQTFSFRAGVAGVAGANNGAPGQAGAESVFGPFSSANGSISANGYVNILSGVIYGRPGKAGAKGGNGGSGGNSSSASADNGSTGESVEQYQGGIGSSGWYDKASLSVRTESYGGSGGGGSARGKKGGNADAYDKGAGKGADATTLRPALNYGDGGNGGSGGGGGGSGGGMYINLGQGVAKDGFSFYHPGATGGLFSPGQNGADGCVIVYY